MTVPSARRRSYAAHVPPKTAPACTPGSARLSRPNVRVIQIEPSFFGKPWTQPRASAKSRSTQMYGQVVTCSPSSSGVDDEEELLVLAARGVDELVAVRRSATASRRTAPRARPGSSGYGSSPSGQHGGHGRRVGPVLDHEEVADVVPRRRRDERGAPLGRPRHRESAQRHRRLLPGSAAPRPHPWRDSASGGSGSPSISRLSRSHSIATGSKRKYDRGGSGPQVFDE